VLFKRIDDDSNNNNDDDAHQSEGGLDELALLEGVELDECSALLEEEGVLDELQEGSALWERDLEVASALLEGELDEVSRIAALGRRQARRGHWKVLPRKLKLLFRWRL
jgi:hypothetical protein